MVVIGIIVLLIGNQRYQTALQTARQRLLAEERAASSTCTISDIGLDGLTSRVEGNYVYVSGRLINRCDSPTGVQVKVTLYDAAGNVLYSWDGWPASVSNVGPKSDYPFTTMVDNVHGWDRMDVRVIEVRKW